MVNLIVPVPLVDTDGVAVIITAGADYDIVVTLTRLGAVYDVTGFTITGSIKQQGGLTNFIDGKALALTTPASGIVTFSLLAAETILFFTPNASKSLRLIPHLGDIKVVESGGTVRPFGPFIFPVRRSLT